LIKEQQELVSSMTQQQDEQVKELLQQKENEILKLKSNEASLLSEKDEL